MDEAHETGGRMKGRKPTPARLRLVKGNAGHRPIPEGPDVPVEIPTKPPHLSVIASQEWDRIAPQLYTAGLLTSIDLAALSTYCQAFGRWVEAEEQIKTHGVLVKSPSGFPMVSPYLIVANKAMEQLSKALVEFGMSPSSRSRVKASAPQKKESPVARFLRQV